jgi:hypothetical protein
MNNNMNNKDKNNKNSRNNMNNKGKDNNNNGQVREYELRKGAVGPELRLAVPYVHDLRSLAPLHLYDIVVCTRCAFDARDVAAVRTCRRHHARR